MSTLAIIPLKIEYLYKSKLQFRTKADAGRGMGVESLWWRPHARDWLRPDGERRFTEFSSWETRRGPRPQWFWPWDRTTREKMTVPCRSMTKVEGYAVSPGEFQRKPYKFVNS
jgi:hypothetical protein